MAKFSGTVESLADLIARLGLLGKWQQQAAGSHQFREDGTGAIMNWWPTTGKINFQGPVDAKKSLEDSVSMGLTSGGLIVPASAMTAAPSVKTPPVKPKVVFVVHGHDEAAREQLELVLYILNLNPYVLQNTAGGGMTIIEALEEQIGKKPEMEFGIVLMTPDDMGYAAKDGTPAVQPRARQNVVLEMGMLISSMGRKNVAMLVKGHMELPSDASGIIYLRFNNHVKEIVPKLTQRLREAGFDLDADAIARASS